MKTVEGELRGRAILAHRLGVATRNSLHFDRIPGLRVITAPA